MKERSQETYLPERLTVPSVGWRDLANLSSTCAQSVLPYDFCKKNKILPLSIVTGSETFLTVLCNHEPSLELGKEIRFLAGMNVELETASIPSLEYAIDAAYLGSEAALLLATKSVPQTEIKNEQTRHDLSSDAPIPKLLETIISRGFSLGASDFHLEASGINTRLRYRTDGRLRDEPIDGLSIEIVNQLIRRVKILSGIDILELSKPVDGSFEFKPDGQQCSLRVSIVPILEGEKLVVRYLENSTPALLSSLGLNNFQLEQFKAALSSHAGVVLLSGPTGSGKTTLLYSALEYLKKGELNITTIEEPVEKRIAGVTQSQVDRTQGLGFAELLRSLLRQDPDIIMIGEIREKETAETALNAAITGHLVLSTVHAANVFEIILRLQQLVKDRELLTKPLRLLSSQRLIPLNCKSCRRPSTVSHSLRKFLGVSLNQNLIESSGCKFCKNTGIKGRTGVFEFLTVDENIREALLANLPTSELLLLARDAAYVPYQFSVRDLLNSGDISPREALRALGVPPDLCLGASY